MSEFAPIIEDPDELTSLALKIGNTLLEDKAYCHLSFDDLRQGGLIKNDQNFADFIVKELNLDISLQKKAFDNIVESLPESSDEVSLQEIRESQIITSQEENEVRMKIFGKTSETKQKLGFVSGKENLSKKIITSSDLWESKYDNSFDPDKLTDNLNLYENMLQQEPETILLDGQLCFALKVPRTKIKDEDLYNLIETLVPPTTSEYIVVTDPQKNKELSDYFFSQQNLVRYFLAKSLESVQREKLNLLDKKFQKIAGKKYEDTEAEVKNFNKPVILHAFNLLLKDAKQKGVLEIINVFRDRHDTESYKEEKPAKLDRIGSESGSIQYKVRPGENNELIFARINGDKEKFDVYVKKAKDNLNFPLKFGSKDKFGKIEYTIGDTRKNQEYSVYHFFRTISVVQIEDLLKFGPKAFTNSENIVSQLLQTQNSVEFFELSKEMKISWFPGNEKIINLNPRVKFFVDVLTNIPGRDKANKN